MLNSLIIVSYIIWVVCLLINKFSLYSIMLLVPTTMFSVRKYGVHISMGNIFVTEFLFLFFSIMMKLMFHNFILSKLILTLLVRAIFVIIVLYDDMTFVYVTEERKRIND